MIRKLIQLAIKIVIKDNLTASWRRFRLNLHTAGDNPIGACRVFNKPINGTYVPLGQQRNECLLTCGIGVSNVE